MPKINVYLSDDLAIAVRDAQVPVSAICQKALERAVRDVASVRASGVAPPEDSPGLGVFARFTGRARTALTMAEQAARDARHSHVGTEHVLLALLDEGGNLGIKVLESLDIEVADLRTELVASMAPAGDAAVEGHIPFSPRAKQALEETTKEALVLLHNYIGCEHVLLGLIATEKGLASVVLRRMGVELVTTRRAVVSALAGVVHSGQDPTPSKPEPSKPEPVAADPSSEPALATADALAQILQRLDTIEQRLAD
jgi:ATP-dependent Clp protease ATP-binding subunit ClpA